VLTEDKGRRGGETERRCQGSCGTLPYRPALCTTTRRGGGDEAVGHQKEDKRRTLDPRNDVLVVLHEVGGVLPQHTFLGEREKEEKGLANLPGSRPRARRN